MPKGNFQGDSSYQQTYIEKEMEKNQQFRPEQQLKVGGKFEGQSKYLSDFYDKGHVPREKKAEHPNNHVIPEGQFQGDSSYQNTYIEKQMEKNQQFRPEQQLKVGGKF